jgi:predicted nucleotidyltransferase
MVQRVADDLRLKQITDTIVAAMKPKRILLFGSRARGDGGPDSDYDLLVEMDSSLPIPQRAMAIDRLFLRRRFSMDVFVFTPAEIRELRDRLGSIVYTAEREGVTLYAA